jgi:hypothetical protein
VLALRCQGCRPQPSSFSALENFILSTTHDACIGLLCDFRSPNVSFTWNDNRLGNVTMHMGSFQESFTVDNTGHHLHISSHSLILWGHSHRGHACLLQRYPTSLIWMKILHSWYSSELKELSLLSLCHLDVFAFAPTVEAFLFPLSLSCDHWIKSGSILSWTL